MPENYKPNILTLIVVCGFIAVGMYYVADSPKQHHRYTYLALGDSYTIGTNEQYNNNYPNQVVQLLRKQQLDIADPVIIAHAGWTTGKLLKGLNTRSLRDTFSFVSLLIGTNNQFSRLGTEQYRTEFEALLKGAIAYASGKGSHVFVLSLPDWTVTPFAWYFDKKVMSREFDAYNAACREITTNYKCRFIDVTADSRAWIGNMEYLAADSLHFSAKGYAVWAEKLAEMMIRATGE